MGDAERGQIAAAAARLELPLSGFVRQAALMAAARVEKKVSPAVVKPHEAAQPPKAAERERGLVVVDPLPGGHWVDGERVR